MLAESDHHLHPWPLGEKGEGGRGEKRRKEEERGLGGGEGYQN